MMTSKQKANKIIPVSIPIRVAGPPTCFQKANNFPVNPARVDSDQAAGKNACPNRLTPGKPAGLFTVNSAEIYILYQLSTIVCNW